MICQELLRGLVTLVVGLAVARLSLWFYFRQKEYELVKQRYLEQCVDVVATELESLLGTFRHNWTRALQIVRDYRDMEDLYDIEQLSKGFLDFNNYKFLQVAHGKMYMLTQSNSVWNVYQLAMAFAASSNAIASKEIPEGIRLRLKKPSTVPNTTEEIVEKCMTALKKLDDESHKFSHLQHALSIFATELEQQRMDFRSVRHFSNRPNVVAAVSELRKAFGEELAIHTNGL